MISESILQEIKVSREQGLVVGYTSGVFDLFHEGHESYLCAAGSACDFLVVGVDADIIVQRKKGRDRPRDHLDQRLMQVAMHPNVAVAFEKTCPADEFLPLICPQIYFIPDNRDLPASRIKMLADLQAKLCILPYFKRLSTSEIIKQRP